MNIVAIVSFVASLCAGVLAFVVLFQERKSLGHWLFAAGMGVFAAEAAMVGFAADSVSLEQLAALENWRFLLIALLPAPWLGFSLIYARGNAVASLRKWRLSLIFTLVVPILAACLWQGELMVIRRQAAATEAGLLVGDVGRLLHIFLLLSCILAMVNLERTFRASVGTMRWRIKFMVVGLGVLFTVRAYTSSQALLFRELVPGLHALDAAALLVACLLVLRTLLRTGHFEVSVYPSQSVLHNSFTIMLAGIYLFIVGLLAKLVSFLGGDAGFQLKALVVLVALVILSMVLLSDRVRLWTKQFVSRHFQRPMYDYRTVWQTFVQGTARQVEQTELSSAIVKMVSEVFQALSVTLWLLDERKENLAMSASTLLSEVKAGQIRLEPSETAAVVHALAAHAQPFDLDESKEHWAAALRRAHPYEFRHGGNRVCVPLSAGGELLGLVILGDRVGGSPFSFQDFDLLKSVGDQAGASLLNIQLSQKLSQAKQLEAFQAMSAFFVHDLKNTASTLSLMLQNLPVHYGDPNFREDALRGIGKTVTHINDVISRLGELRHGLALHTVETDLNRVVEDAVAAWAGAKDVELVTQMAPLPKLHLDPAQIQKVVTNLLLNAREAMASNGRIDVATSTRAGWIVLSVKDNGAGMSQEFINSRLFRPFQTTKKRGIGIGMFHCKLIVEAHRGRIEVTSQQGKGTEFRVLLPLTPQTA